MKQIVLCLACLALIQCNLESGEKKVPSVKVRVSAQELQAEKKFLKGTWIPDIEAYKKSEHYKQLASLSPKRRANALEHMTKTLSNTKMEISSQQIVLTSPGMRKVIQYDIKEKKGEILLLETSGVKKRKDMLSLTKLTTNKITLTPGGQKSRSALSQVWKRGSRYWVLGTGIYLLFFLHSTLLSICLDNVCAESLFEQLKKS